MTHGQCLMLANKPHITYRVQRTNLSPLKDVLRHEQDINGYRERKQINVNISGFSRKAKLDHS